MNTVTYISETAKQAALAKHEAITAYHTTRRAYHALREHVGLQLNGRTVIDLIPYVQARRIARKLSSDVVVNIIHYK